MARSHSRSPSYDRSRRSPEDRRRRSPSGRPRRSPDRARRSPDDRARRSPEDRARRSPSDRPRRSPTPRSRSRSQDSQVSSTIETVRLTDADAAFILGKAGKTKEKIAAVSGAFVELPPRSLTLEISGTAEQRRKAKKYVECVMSQRSGDVIIDERDSLFMEDCTLVDVPTECVGFVTGTNGNFLRTLEAENGTIMFFVLLKGDGGRKPRGMERLAIFGPLRGRRSCELKVMTAIEQKMEGYLTKNLRDHVSDTEDFSTDIKKLRMDEMSWALGRKGATRKKIARASGAIVEYVGSYVHISGTKQERRHAREYLACVMEQMDNRHSQINVEGRDDVTVMRIPQECVGYVMGNKRATLTRIEEESGAFMLFLDRKGESNRNEYVKLGVFGLQRNRRAAELKVMSSVEGKAPGYYTRDLREGVDDRDGWGTDVLRFHGEEFSYALGKDGTTRKKLARASHCLMEYVGEYAVMSGTRIERRRAMKYLKWLLKQKSGAVTLEGLNIDGRDDDVKLMDIPSSAVAYVMGPKGIELRRIEDETNTFLFLARDRNNTEVLVICGADKNDRRHAEYALHQAVNEAESGGRRDDRYSDRDEGRYIEYGPPSKRSRVDDDYYRRSRSPSYGRSRRSPSYGRYRSPSHDRRRSRGRYDSRDRSDRRSRDRVARIEWRDDRRTDRRDDPRDDRRDDRRGDSRGRKDDRYGYDDRRDSRRDDRRSRDRYRSRSR